MRNAKAPGHTGNMEGFVRCLRAQPVVHGECQHLALPQAPPLCRNVQERHRIAAT